ncbi:MAG TPA: GreA/GreB family elongation factor [Verrucomicrobiae bacterium]
MKKQALIKKIIAQLTADLKLYYKAALSARAEATDPQSKAENKYDTRGLEASYLARGQSRQAAETEAAIEEFQKLIVKDFTPEEPINLGALVELDAKGEKMLYFIASRSGGLEVIVGKRDILVITPQSPLGQQLIGKKQGDRIKMEIAGTKSDYRILSVS